MPLDTPHDNLAFLPDQNQFIAVACESEAVPRQKYAQQIARQLNLPQVAINNKQFICLLVVTDQRLELRPLLRRSKPLAVDFFTPALNYRRLQGGGKNQLLARAVGIKGSYRPDILDATAGLGTDGFIMACLGCNVHWLERSPIVAVLLQDGLERFARQTEVELALRLTITDSVDWLNKLSPQAATDVIYLDPMFPERGKAALGKLSMRIIHQLVGADEDAERLLAMALQYAKKRVVVKRPRMAPVIANTLRRPDIVFKGKSSRFDVYLQGIKI